MANLRHILFPYDFSDQGRQAAPFVKALASRFGARVTLYSVVPPTFEPLPDRMPPLYRLGADSKEWRAELQAQLNEALVEELGGVTVERVTDGGDAGVRIVDFAQTHDVDLIMMPTHGLGLFRSLFVGSATTKVLEDATCPVWTAAHVERQTTPTTPRNIVCAVDGGVETAGVARYAVELARVTGAAVRLLHVVEPISDWPSLAGERELQEQMREREETALTSTLKSAGVEAPYSSIVGRIVPTVAEEARQGHADLVVVGRGLAGRTLGRLRSHVFDIIQQTPCPVLSV